MTASAVASFKIESTRDLSAAQAFAERSPDYDGDLKMEVQTDKTVAKLLPCRGCRRPLVVNAFYAAARASCSKCGLPRQHAALLNSDEPRAGSVVTAGVLAETLARYPDCRCHLESPVTPGYKLEEGMPSSDLIELEEGCTGSRQSGGATGWVCPRLDLVRRRCGK